MQPARVLRRTFLAIVVAWTVVLPPTPGTAVAFQAPAPAAAVTAKITRTESGGLIVLDACQSTGAKHYAWKIIPEDTAGFIVVDCDHRAVFSPAVGGKYSVVLAVSDEAGGLAIAVEVIDTGPPGPPAPPKPADLAKQIKDAITGPTAAVDAGKLSTAFTTLAAYVEVDGIQGTPKVATLADVQATFVAAMGRVFAPEKVSGKYPAFVVVLNGQHATILGTVPGPLTTEARAKLVTLYRTVAAVLGEIR